MMNRTITTEEINRLFTFCRDHFVYHYDLQVELVDHLASSIEEKWETNPDLSFEEALYKTFRKFGVTGFSKIKEQKQRELRKRYNRLLWKYLFEYFSWPKIVMTFAFTIVLATLFKVVDNDILILVPYFVSMTVLLVYYYYKIFPKRYKVTKVNGKKFMLLDRLKDTQFMIIFFIQIPFQAFHFWNILNLSSLQNTAGIIAVSLGIVTITIGVYGELFYVPSKIKEHFQEQFPEFAL